MRLGIVVANLIVWLEGKPVLPGRKTRRFSVTLFELADGYSVEVKQRHIMNTPRL